MSWIKATINSIHARRHPDAIACQVEAELRFHIEMRTAANIVDGMKPDEARVAAALSFGDFDRVKDDCCEISRSLPFDSRILRMGLHIAVACLAGGAALWAVNVPHDNFVGVLRQLVVIAVMTWVFVSVRRARSRERFAIDSASGILTTGAESSGKQRVPISEMREEAGGRVAAYDEQGGTPIERVFKSK